MVTCRRACPRGQRTSLARLLVAVVAVVELLGEGCSFQVSVPSPLLRSVRGAGRAQSSSNSGRREFATVWKIGGNQRRQRSAVQQQAAGGAGEGREGGAAKRSLAGAFVKGVQSEAMGLMAVGLFTMVGLNAVLPSAAVAAPGGASAIERSLITLADDEVNEVQTSKAVDVSGNEVDKAIRALKTAQGSSDIMEAMVRIEGLTDLSSEGTVDDNLTKEAITKALIDTKKAAGDRGQWNGDLDFGYAVLKRRLDPFSTVALRPYLSIAPYYGGLLYIGVFVVQQTKASFFPAAYIAAVVALVLPGLGLVLWG